MVTNIIPDDGPECKRPTSEPETPALSVSLHADESDPGAPPTVVLAGWLPRDSAGRVLRPAAGQIGTMAEQLVKAAAPRPKPDFSRGDVERLRRQVAFLQRHLFGDVR
ncbi:hypothetical protein [Limnoglobus roseus]|uniref:Uncharacterized protein n=1 Tax=Limnoglobus roseus TaxID=2598579 RepID=A0A5C1AA10_9BACT|nr:hypothetical protein [Limnoglobus roseus]QEL14652.1 hypothetical protein PX52LOC_01545 [Limnoglobus roseus]